MFFVKEILNPVVKSIVSFPERDAFCINKKFYTYKEFGQTISKIRLALRQRPHNNPLVGLVINDDLESYAAIFALWLEGEGYVPLHINWPIDRCENIISQIEADLILDSSTTTRYNNAIVMSTHDLAYTADCLDVDQTMDDNGVAYILFTSGSTGLPKGVQLSRENIGAFMDSFWKTGIEINEEDRCLQCFDLTFDVSIQSYLVPLTRGACCFTVPYGIVKWMYVGGLIDEFHITFGAMAPSMLRYLEPYFDEMDVTSLKALILTAEACPAKLMEEWWKYAINTDLYDFYGPTEGTIYITYYKLNKGGENKTLNGIISIGKPMANAKAIIIDENGNIVPSGVKGELCFAGAQISLGYHKNPEKNAEAFFYKEVDGETHRFYHTGDLCYMDEDGDIMYSGRLDFQAKIQGFRVELGEIEFHAREFLKDHNVICVAFQNANDLTEIAMFIESEEFDNNELLAYMRTKMPAYMIPSRFYYVPVFPLNSNDKVDRKQLKTLIKNV